MTEKLREKIRSGESYFGLYISLFDPTTIELAAMAGYDMIRIDLEHNLFSQAELREMIRTATALGLPAFVRVPSLSCVTAILDTGASGIVVPNIESRESAMQAIREVKYAPIGLRGMAASQRCTSYGYTKLSDYTGTANSDVMLCVQIESREGVEQIDDIVSLEGIDMVSSGKQDLSQSYGVPGQITHPTVVAAEQRVIERALSHGKQPVLLVASAERKRALYEMGVRGFMAGRDTQLLRDAVKANLAKYQE